MRLQHKSWWTEPQGQVYENLFNTFNHIDESQNYRQEMNLHNMRMFSNRQAIGMSGADYSQDLSNNKLKMNVIRAVIDTAEAFIATNRPRPQYLTLDGNFGMQRKARGLTEFIQGQFYAIEQYIMALRVFRDGAIYGTGVEKVYPDFEENKVCAERIFTNEIVVDDREARYGKPRQMFQHREVDRYVLQDKYPGKKGQISDAKVARQGIFDVEYYAADPVSVVEAWHLPSSSKAKDGRHAVCISNATLVDEPWTRDRFPFSFFKWSESAMGFWGSGLAEQLTEIQVEINYLLQKIQTLMTLATTQVWVESGSKVNVSGLNNENMGIRSFTGRPPIFMPVQSVSPEYFQHIDRLYDRAFEVAGISQMRATQEKPAGLDSGKALREYNDMSNNRFLHTQQRWEQFHMDVSELMIQAARDLAEKNGDYTVLAKGRNSARLVSFKDVDLDRDKYVMQVFPTNFLPDTPAGKLQTLKEFQEIMPAAVPQLVSQMEFPDLDAVASLTTSPVDMCDMLLEEMLEKGHYRPPEPTMQPVELFMQRMTLALLRADINNAPESHMQLVRQFLAEMELLHRPPPAMPPAPAMPGAPGEMPLGPGGMPPPGLPPPPEPTAQAAMAAPPGALPPPPV